MMMRNDSKNVSTLLGVGEIAHRQIGSALGIPAKYYDKMRAENPELLAQNVNSWFTMTPQKRMVRTLDGNARASVYAALAERGFFPVEELSTHYANGSRLSGHVSHKGVPGVEFSTGSLGHGLSVAAGMALGGKKDNADWRVYCVLGDGECDEGSVWEAALQAHQFKLDNLVAIIDHNRMQSLDFCENTLALEPFGDKWRAFGWNVIETDGNDVDAVEKALRQAQENRGSGRPTVVIAVTTKGKGVSFMENDILWHYRTPQGEEYDAALAELEAQRP